MNLLFLLLAAGLLLIALLIIIIPLWRVKTVNSIDIDARNVAIARQQLHELNAQLQAGRIERLDYENQRAEIELALSDNLALKTASLTAIPAPRWLNYLLILALPLLAIGLYNHLGAFQAIEPSAAMLGTTNTDNNNPSPEQMQVMVAKLADYAQSHRDDSKAWLMLGKSYKYLQQYSLATQAFAHAYSLLGEQPEIMLLYAEALAFEQNEQLAGKPAELAFKALALEPNNIQALWLTGMAKAQAGDAAQAINLWNKLESLLPNDSPAKQETAQLLARLKSELTANNAAQIPAVENLNAAINPQIKVQVSLAPELKAKVNNDAAVFIYAQSATTQKMPLAVIRKQVKDLPIEVVLTDALAMMPTMKLSNFKQVLISARVSLTNQAMAQSGDFIGSIEGVAVNDTNAHAIIIKQLIP